MAASDKKISVLFVCLGNICRSPMAGAVFDHLVTQRGLRDRFDRIESAGTSGMHEGEDPDSRTTATCKKHGVPISSTAQHADADLISQFDCPCTSSVELTHADVIGMDEQNTKNLIALKNRCKARADVRMFGDFVSGGQRIADPYYGRGDAGFEKAYDQIMQYSDGLLAELGLAKAKS